MPDKVGEGQRSLEDLFNSLMQSNSAANVSAVSLKLPAFWPNLPVEWFLQVEALFSTRSISSQQTRFNYVLTALPCDVISTVIDVIQYDRENVSDPYDQLKAAILNRLVKSESRRIEELLNGTSMGDRTPSEYYRHMKVLAGTSSAVNEDLLRNLWLRNLPALVQTSVTASGKTEVPDMLAVADKVYEVYERQASFTPLAASGAGISELVAQNQKMLEEIASLKESVSRIKDSRRSRSRSRDRGRDRSRQRNRSESEADMNGMCWYHFTYGDAARKCRPPCVRSSSIHPN